MTTQLNSRTIIQAVRDHPLPARLGAAAVVVAAAIGIGLVLPRGPMTSFESVSVFILLAVVGVAAGILSRTRWAALLAPMLFAAVFEVVRLRVTGPTVDAVRLGDIYGILAFVAGRGFDAIVLLLPLAFGALWGTAVAPRITGAVPTRKVRLRRVGIAVSGVVAALLLVALVRPAATDPILDADGNVVEGSIAELVTVPIGGHDQSLMLRGADADAPVLLFLEGGPGGTATGSMRVAGKPLEDHFVVATWDQRGTGASAHALEPTSTLTLDQMIADAIEVTEYLCDRFDEQAIYVVGSSWGTTLGVLAVQQRPDLYHAYVGTGQMVDQFETDTLMYAESLAYAERVGDEAFADRLREIGEPPYDDTFAYTQALAANPEWVDYPRGEDYDMRAEYPQSLFVGEFTLTEQVRAAAGMFETFAVLYPQLEDVDLRRTVLQLEVPVYLIEGAYEVPGRATLAYEWFEELKAPSKQLVVFDRSGHTPQRDEPGRFADFLAGVVLAETAA
ncbi:MAG: alpha/beta hydrolase [Actinobacteria bacterium HGW-Actinobacteria-8]|nr:MAG: alpha/beta hydrolase [Actinobacteria bacterium HGW-Actinobacteria-8]